MTGHAPVRVEIIAPDAADELRRVVLRPEIPAGTPVPAFAPPDALHLGALDDNDSVIGTCVVFPQPCPERPAVEPAWQLRGMAVDPRAQGGGVGSAVLRAAIEQIRARGGALLWCNARDTALAFYRRHGFVVDGEGFDSPATGLPHHAMWLELPGHAASSD